MNIKIWMALQLGGDEEVEEAFAQKPIEAIN